MMMIVRMRSMVLMMVMVMMMMMLMMVMISAIFRSLAIFLFPEDSSLEDLATSTAM